MKPPSFLYCICILFFGLIQETGVGKTVNSLRKHDQAGEVAKTLVAKWKKLVPQATDR